MSDRSRTEPVRDQEKRMAYRTQGFNDALRGDEPRQRENAEYMRSYRRGRERRQAVSGA